MKKNPAVSWKILWDILREHVWSGPRFVFILGAVSMIIGALSTAALTQWVKPVIDDIFIQHRVDRLMIISFGVFFIFFMRGLSEYSSHRCSDFLGERLVRSLQTRLFQHILGMNIDFFRENHEGMVMSLLTHDVRVIRTVMIETMMMVLNRSLMVIFLAITMVKSSITMFWIVMWLVPITGFLTVYSQKKARDLSAKLAVNIANLSVFFQQIFQNIILVKSSHTEAKELQNMDIRMQSLWEKAISFSKIHSTIHPVMDIVAGISIAVGIFFVGQEVMQQKQTVGEFFTFVMALVFIYPPIKNIIALNTKMQEGLVSAKRIHDVLALPCEPILFPKNIEHTSQGAPIFSQVKRQESRPSHACEAGAVDAVGTEARDAVGAAMASQDLVLDRVRFGYETSEKLIFQDFSCRFLGGKKMALVGNSGEGKTTLLYLLLRLYTPQSGHIFIGDSDIQNIPMAQWRKNIAFVGQEIALFSDTVAANIAYGVSATPDQIKQAAAMAYADEFIDLLPNGYETQIGTRGLMLSGGQRQRLALARAFLRNSPIVLLDEATSALDGTSEKKIKEATFRLMEQRTTLMIAHRFSTIEAADVIFVLDHGQVVQQGSHQELMAEQGLYKKWAGIQQLSI